MTKELKQARKGVTAIFAVAGFALPVILILQGGYNETLLAVTAMVAAVAVALIMGQWTRN